MNKKVSQKLESLKKTLKNGSKILFYLIFALILLTILTVIIFEASGYRYNFKTKKIQKTGLLVLDISQNNLNLYTDNKPLKIKKKFSSIGILPPAINLLPGLHLIKITKENYHPWNKTIEIIEEKVTKIKGVFLFPLNPKQNTFSLSKTTLAKISPDKKKLIYIPEASKQKEILIFDFQTGTSNKIFPASKDQQAKLGSQKIDDFSWSPDSKQILIRYSNQQKKSYAIISATNPHLSLFLMDSFTFLPLFENLVFSTNPNILYGMEGKSLYYLDLQGKGTPILIDTEVTNFNVFNNWLYYVKNDYQIFRAEPSGQKKIELTYEGKFKNIKLVGPDNSSSPLLLVTDGATYSYQEQNNQLILNKITDSFNDLHFDSDKIFFATDFEIWEFDEDKKFNLISRFSSPISKVMFLPSNYLIYATDNEIKAIELDGTNNLTLFSKTEVGKTLDLKWQGSKKIIWLEDQADDTKVIIVDFS